MKWVTALIYAFILFNVSLATAEAMRGHVWLGVATLVVTGIIVVFMPTRE